MRYGFISDPATGRVWARVADGKITSDADGSILGLVDSDDQILTKDGKPTGEYLSSTQHGAEVKAKAEFVRLKRLLVSP